MPMKTNCVNCGAPVQLNQCACPYCTTPYEMDESEYHEVTLYTDNQVFRRIIVPDRNYILGGFVEYGRS